MRKWLAFFSICFFPYLSGAQGWEKTAKVDPFTGNSYVQFDLVGTFLTPPRDASVVAPHIILKCFPGEKRYSGKWYSEGRLMNAWVDSGAILNNTPRGVAVLYRRDDGKPQSRAWTVSTDGKGLFPPDIDLNDIFFGHFLPHKVSTTPPVTKLVLMADEYLGVGIVMQFDLSGIENIAGGCGLAIHEKN